MKNRKLVITAFVLVAVLLMAVGFAALVDDLYVTGTAGISADDARDAIAEDIYFTRAVMTTEAGTALIVADDNGDAKDKVTIDVKDGALKGAGDYVICAVEISNVGDVDAWVQLDAITVHTNNEYFKVTTNWDDSKLHALAAGKAVDVTVTITCIKTPLVDVSTNFDITFTAYDADPTTTP